MSQSQKFKGCYLDKVDTSATRKNGLTLSQLTVDLTLAPNPRARVHALNWLLHGEGFENIEEFSGFDSNCLKKSTWRKLSKVQGPLVAALCKKVGLSLKTDVEFYSRVCEQFKLVVVISGLCFRSKLQEITKYAEKTKGIVSVSENTDDFEKMKGGGFTQVFNMKFDNLVVIQKQDQTPEDIFGPEEEEEEDIFGPEPIKSLPVKNQPETVENLLKKDESSSEDEEVAALKRELAKKKEEKRLEKEKKREEERQAILRMKEEEEKKRLEAQAPVGNDQQDMIIEEEEDNRSWNSDLQSFYEFEGVTTFEEDLNEIEDIQSTDLLSLFEQVPPANTRRPSCITFEAVSNLGYTTNEVKGMLEDSTAWKSLVTLLAPKKTKADELAKLDVLLKAQEHSFRENKTIVFSFLSENIDFIKDSETEIKKMMELYEKYYERSTSFALLVQWIVRELLKPLAEKRKSVLNKALFLQAKSGFGKSTFLENVIKNVFPAGRIFLENDYQPGAQIRGAKIYYSPDNAPLSSFYKYALLPNGEYLINVKYTGVNQVSRDISTIVLTNYRKEQAFRKLKNKEDIKRFERRVVWVDLSNPLFYKFFRAGMFFENNFENDNFIAICFWLFIFYIKKEVPKFEEEVLVPEDGTKALFRVIKEELERMRSRRKKIKKLKK